MLHVILFRPWNMFCTFTLDYYYYCYCYYYYYYYVAVVVVKTTAQLPFPTFAVLWRHSKMCTFPICHLVLHSNISSLSTSGSRKYRFSVSKFEVMNSRNRYCIWRNKRIKCKFRWIGRRWEKNISIIRVEECILINIFG